MAETDVQVQSAQEEQTSPRFELEQADDYSKYLLYSKTEILFVLRSLIQKGAMLTVYFDQGASFLLTSLVAIAPDNASLLFDCGSNDEMNRKALCADKLIFTATLDKVKIQFSLRKLELASNEGQPVFRGALPEALLRLQRREYYRLSTPIANPIECLITVIQENGSTLQMAAPLLDISGGGVGLMLPADACGLYAVGTSLPACRLALPEAGLLSADLYVRNAFDVATKSGSHYLRVGCEYINLPGTRLTMIQRYITRTERERKARLGGMA